MIDTKNLVLIALGLLFVFYVSFEAIREKIILKKSSCEGSCVRFCDDEKNLTIDFDMPAFANLSRNAKEFQNKYCPDRGYLEDDAKWSFLENGKVLVEGEDTKEFLNWPFYCLSNSTEDGLIIFTCLLDTAADNIEHNYPYFMLTSVPFLIITIFIYAWISELRNLPGKCLMSYAASVTLMYLVYAFSKIYHDEMLNKSFLCKAAGYFQFLSLMMCFMWLNVLCFDVWSTIRKIQSSNGNILFLKYCLYGFGVPVLLTILILTLNSIESVPDDIKHNLGDGVCFITGGDENNIVDLIYRIIPLSVLLSMNIIFYSITAFTIFKIQKQSDKTLTKSNNRFSDNKHRFFLYFRLFILMGISWISEIISDFTSKSLILNSMSIINSLQGVLIFMHFIWRSRVESHIRKKLNLKQPTKSETRVETTTSMLIAPGTDTASRKFSVIALNTMSSATETP